MPDDRDQFSDSDGPTGDKPPTPDELCDDATDSPRSKGGYQRLFEMAPDAILVVDREGRYIAANTAACELTGYSLDELLGMRVGDLAVPEQRAWSAERFDLLRRTGRTRRDRILQRKDGTHVNVEAHAVDLGNGTFQTTLRDTSQQVEARAELERSLDAYSTLVDLCHAAVISAGPDGLISSWNPGAQAIFGHTADEAIGMPITNLSPIRHRARHLAAYSRHVSAPPARPFSRVLATEGLRADGTEVPIEISVSIGLRAGTPFFTAVIRDVTEQRATFEKLNDALQRLRFHVERMPLAYIVWDDRFHVLEWNPAAERTFGFSKAEAINRHAYDLIVPTDEASAVDVVWRNLLLGDTSSHSINANVRKDGTRLTCEWFNTPLRDSQGQIHGVASMVMDISMREAIEAKTRDAQKLESLGVMAAGIAHDFNSSLMVMLGNTALLRSIKRMPKRANEHLELIEEAGGRADGLIKQLLWYARTGRHKPQPTDLNAVVREALRFIRTSLGTRHELELHLADAPPIISADRSQVEQILINLCLNARDAMQDGGTIHIETRSTELSVKNASLCTHFHAKPGRYIELIVSDTGYGMDDSTVARIFDPFFTTKEYGHGLGLAAVMGILRQHGAVARIDSTRRQGTKIHIYFPITREAGTDH